MNGGIVRKVQTKSNQKNGGQKAEIMNHMDRIWKIKGW